MRSIASASSVLWLLIASAPTPAAAAPARTLPDSIRYVTRIADLNEIGVTLTNYGVIGNNFVSRSPSLEYPLGTGFEHLTLGGLWIGAHAADGVGSFTGVTTGAQEFGIGASPVQRTEFTPAGVDIIRASRVPSSPHYDPGAVSDMDYRWAFSDQPARAGSPEAHRPLNVLVRASALSWASSGLRDFVILRFTIINLGAPMIGAHVGLWTELASGPKNAYSTWPPSSSGSPIGGWFSKKWVQYDASLRLVREHYCAALPVPDGCILSRVPAWMGVQLLTHPGAGQGVTLAAWTWSPGNALRDEDVERYAIMSAGTIQDLTQPDLMPQTGDPVELLAVGPFESIASGDSIAVDFALVGGAEVADIQANAAMAQLFYDSGFDVPTATEIALVSADASPDAASLRWFAGQGETAVDVQRRVEPGEWQDIARIVADGEGYLTFEDRDVRSGGRYGYRVLADGTPFGETWLDVPLASELALFGARPNPSSGQLGVWFSLPDAAPARIDLWDVAGRRVLTRDVGLLGAGRHVVALTDDAPLPAGVYLIRLTRGGRSLTARAVVVR